MFAATLCLFFALATTAPPPAAEPRPAPGALDRASLVAGYAGLYGSAAAIGTRLGLERRFVARRLESAYVYDLVAHAWVTRGLAESMAGLHRRAGSAPLQARREGAWLGAFGALTAMEILNGFMPGVRFDPWDVPANAAGAWLAAEGPGFARRHAWARRLSFQFGYKDIGRVFGPPRLRGERFGNLWHDYPNGRLALGVDVGPSHRPWFVAMLAHELTSFELPQMRNRFALGVELAPLAWFQPVLARLPGGGRVLGALAWLDRRFILPGTYVELLHVDLPAFSDQEPFGEH